MNKWAKVGLAVGVGTAAVTVTHLINRLIFSSATADQITDIDNRKTYKWKFGSISYTVRGEGAPLLLIHDLESAGSSFEWKHVAAALARDHTVYTMDLLGCGYSDKPNITYTTYMYTQLMNDFVVNIINKKTDVIAAGHSAPLTIMSAYNNPLIFNKILLVNPQSIKSAMVNPDSKSNIRRILLNAPIIGTLIYNMCMRREKLRRELEQELFDGNTRLSAEIVKACHENAHLYGSSAKFLYTSTVCHYTTASISRAVSELENCIYIITGQEAANAQAVVDEYLALNPAIETAGIACSKKFPQLEQPKSFVKTVRIYL